ncbi:glutathione S-transferase family protein [Rhizobium sp. Root1220]|uniref:glutathione S-transferase family protein n=1 Tax=Rhizobium sp. Root1220 TaxID=1736432 RepID=UPI0006FB25CF|nr:glutathione S-transferase family protein [Rhizobium sp. Root1220]KQV81700.1 glutathione S-transferase [Rhizobium sp. Root1220]
MTLVLHQHPLASFCHKVLIALYENDTPFEAVLVNLGDEASRAAFLRISPLGKMPALRDEARNRTVLETSIIVEYIDRYHAGSVRFVPEDFDHALEVRLWDRFFDLYVQEPMQQIVGERLRPNGDQNRADDARGALIRAYGVIDQQLGDHIWITGDSFTLADCAAAPALFYAETLVPFADDLPRLEAYYQRLLERPSFARVLREAMPYFKLYPYRENLPARFRPHENAQ